jgi:hypothetical protein
LLWKEEKKFDLKSNLNDGIINRNILKTNIIKKCRNIIVKTTEIEKKVKLEQVIFDKVKHILEDEI